MLTFTWASVDSRAECVGVSLALVDKGAPMIVTSTVWRDIPIRTLIAQARQARFEESGGTIAQGATEQDLLDQGIDPSWLDHFGAISAPWRESQSGRPRKTTAFYREVAAVYSSALAEGGTQKPLLAVQQRWGAPKPTASRWVRAARDLKLLPKTGRGRVGAQGDGRPTNSRATK
jgi:hypothetical protein